MKKLRNWFIGDYLAKTEDVFERAKITLTYNFAIFFLIQAMVMYGNIIANELWYHFYIVSLGFVSMFVMLFVLKKTQNIKLASQLWLIQFIFIGTGTMMIQGGGMDMMSAFWIMVELLFAYFTLGGKWAVVALVHVLLQVSVAVLNDVKFHGTLLDFGIPESQRLPHAPVFTMIPFTLCIYIITRFLRTQDKAKKLMKEQKTLLEESHKETIDSITYARRIQRSLMPTEVYILRQLKRLNDK